MMIFHLLNSFLIGVLLSDFFERRFPDHFRTIMANLVYNIIYWYSKLQILLTQICNKCITFIETNPSLSKLTKQLNTMMKSNKHIAMMEFIKNGEVADDSINYDFVLFSWIGDNKIVHKKIYKMDEPLVPSEQSDIKFILVELCVREKTFKVYLKTDFYNFYLVGNKFNRPFFIYYIKQYKHIGENITDTSDISNTDTISVKLIDHDVNTIQLDFTDDDQGILIEKDHYKIVNMPHIDNINIK